MNSLRLALFTFLAVLLSACTPGASTFSTTASLAVNEGRRMDLVIDDVANHTRYRGDVAGLARSVWSQSPELRSWFMLVDRVSDADNTLMMTLSLDSASTTRSGTLDLPFVGRMPLMRADATVSVTLIDPISGVVLGSATASRSVGDGSADAAMDAALQQAMAEAFYGATIAYAGG